jgi:hypothetical protein
MWCGGMVCVDECRGRDVDALMEHRGDGYVYIVRGGVVQGGCDYVYVHGVCVCDIV